jgi:glutathione S-transferase
MKLITISISHYCEKVKWALKIAGLPYVEESHIPGLHAAVTLWHTRGGHRATPVLIDGSQVISDSTDILRHLTTAYSQKWLYPTPEALELEERFDRQIGPTTRRYIYQLFFENNLSVADLFQQDVVPSWQRAILPVAAGAIKAVMIRDMAINPHSAEAARLLFEKEFDFVADRLRDGRPFLCGNNLTAADITFAALAAPVILPDNYGARLPALADAAADAPVRGIIEGYRSTPAGQFVLRLYRDHR